MTPTEIEKLVERLRAAGHDERLSHGPLYLEAADALAEQRAPDIEQAIRFALERASDQLEKETINRPDDPISNAFDGGCRTCAKLVLLITTTVIEEWNKQNAAAVQAQVNADEKRLAQADGSDTSSALAAAPYHLSEAEQKALKRALVKSHPLVDAAPSNYEEEVAMYRAGKLAGEPAFEKPAAPDDLELPEKPSRDASWQEWHDYTETVVSLVARKLKERLIN